MPQATTTAVTSKQKTETANRIDVSVKGRWISVPALNVGDRWIVVKGGLAKTASVHDEEWLETELGDPELCIKTLKAQPRDGVCADIFTFTQKVPVTEAKYGYYTEYDSIAVATINSFQEWWMSLPQESRKNVRRAERRGLSVSIRDFDDRLISGLMEINNDSPVRQGRRNYHYGKTAEQVHRDHESFIDRSCLICAYVGEELVGFLKLVYRGDVASILQCTPKGSHADKRPANAMIAKAAEVCAAKGIRYITYGKFNYGTKGDSTLREFKVRNGFAEMLIPRFYVPLNGWGAVCLALKLHHGIRGLIPPGVIKQVVSTRAKWYSLREEVISRCSSRVERPNRTRQMGCSIPPAGSIPPD